MPATLAAPIWGRFMRDAVGQGPRDWLAQPGGITTAQVCRVSGALATEACHRDILIDQFGEVIERSQVATEYFRRGTEPQSECPIHNYTYRSGDEYRIGSYRGTLRFGRE